MQSETELLAKLTEHEDIAIQTLTVMLHVSWSVIVGLAGFIIFLINNHRKDMKDAWQHVSTLSEALQSKSEDIMVIKTMAEQFSRRSERD